MTLFGASTAWRIWLDPNKLLQYKLMPSDVINAVNAQNAQVSAGQIGAAPFVEGQQLNLSISVQERLQTPGAVRRDHFAYQSGWFPYPGA